MGSEIVDGPIEAQMTLSGFYSSVQRRAGATIKPLIKDWDAGTPKKIADAIRAALKARPVAGKEFDRFSTDQHGTPRSNQSKGNVAADALALALTGDGRRLRIESMPGLGYPDRVLSMPGGFRCCLELKLTGDWNERDSNRRVLTSSLDKLDKAITATLLPNPPNHLLATVVYDRASNRVQHVRLDFLQPDTLVNVRIEASTSHKLLAQGKHHFVTIP